MQNRFYVYAHFKPKSSIPFYIGKGCGRRAWDLRQRNFHWRNVVKKHGFEVRILHDGLDEEFAFLLETNYIFCYGRIDLGEGCLVNWNDGGEGGSSPSKSTRKKISKALTGRVIGPPTLAHREKLSKANMGKPSGMLGKSHAKKTKILISDALRGKKKSEEHRRKLSESHKNKPWSEKRRQAWILKNS